MTSSVAPDIAVYKAAKRSCWPASSKTPDAETYKYMAATLRRTLDAKGSGF